MVVADEQEAPKWSRNGADIPILGSGGVCQ